MIAETEYTDETEIYLLMSVRDKRARGFTDMKKAFTFAFTTQEKAEAFLKTARSVGILLDTNMLYRMTVGEYFEWRRIGKVLPGVSLTIDPDAEMMKHPHFASLRYSNN